jgi:hypothetical protein
MGHALHFGLFANSSGDDGEEDYYVDREGSSWTVRPVVALGCKSYFNERTFIRSEFLTAFNRQGLAQLTLRAGFGFDF